jgi:peroxiredoxin
MRKLYFILIAFTLFGCEYRNIEITGTAPGMDGWTVTIGHPGKVLFGENIQNGKFHIPQQLLKEPGYYTLMIDEPGKSMGPHFEVYLEPGKYDISLSDKGHKKYPKIQSPSAIQNGLSAYYPLRDSLTNYARSQYDLWLGKLNAPDANTLPQNVYDNVLNNVNLWRDSVDNTQLTIFKTLVKKQPDNPAIPHILKKSSITKNPLAFYKAFGEVSSSVRNSPEGKAIGERLKIYAKLVTGAIAPEIEGLTPDGKKISVKDLHKKVVIIAFWRSGWSIMEDDHFALVNTLIPSLDSKKVGVIGVSFDTDRSKWLETIKKRGLNFTQISDLKGDDSPNAKNWNTTELPNYFILDGEGKILYKDLSYAALTLSIKEYLAKH